MNGNIVVNRFSEYVVERKNKAGIWETVARSHSLDYAATRFKRLRNNARIVREYFKRLRADVWLSNPPRKYRREVIDTNY